MPSCSAINCTNRRPHYKLHRFPSDPKRRKQWIVNVGRLESDGKPWEPSKSHCICEVHFENNQYELGRLDGRKLLKFNAVPTIFSCRESNSSPNKKRANRKRNDIELQIILPPDHINYCHRLRRHELVKIASCDKQEAESELLEQDEILSEVSQDDIVIHHHELWPEGKAQNTNLTEIDKQPNIIITDHYYFSTPNKDDDDELGDNCNEDEGSTIAAEDDEPECQQNENINEKEIGHKVRPSPLSEKYRRLEYKFNALATRMKTTQKQNRQLQRKLKEQMAINEALGARKVFNADQMRALSKVSTRGVKWSEETVEKALKLKAKLGKSGYEALLELKLPLPSLRTLRRPSAIGGAQALTTITEESQALSTIIMDESEVL